MFFLLKVGFCRRLPSRWRPLGQDGAKQLLKSLMFIYFFGFCGRLPSRWRPLGQEGLKNYLKIVFLVCFCFCRRLLLPVGGEGWA